MKSIIVNYNEDTSTIEMRDDVSVEDWTEICVKFNDDVHRVRDAKDQGEFTGLYECFDNYNNKTYYLVEEDTKLYRLRRKNFLTKLGRR